MRTGVMTVVACVVAVLATCAGSGGGNGEHRLRGAEVGGTNIALVEEFSAAQKAGEFDRARAMMGPDPREWYEKREGEGDAWTLGEGRWKEWDASFNARSTHEPWRASDDGLTVWAVFEEMNDYYALLEGGPQRFRRMYFFDGQGRIAGTMISAEPRAEGAKPGRGKEFAAWAKAKYPQEWEYLRPGGQIDPTGDRAARTRRLAMEWRRSVGLGEE